jgi:hypothetical protein
MINDSQPNNPYWIRNHRNLFRWRNHPNKGYCATSFFQGYCATSFFQRARMPIIVRSFVTVVSVSRPWISLSISESPRSDSEIQIIEKRLIHWGHRNRLIHWGHRNRLIHWGHRNRVIVPHYFFRLIHWGHRNKGYCATSYFQEAFFAEEAPHHFFRHRRHLFLQRHRPNKGYCATLFFQGYCATLFFQKFHNIRLIAYSFWKVCPCNIHITSLLFIAYSQT